MTKLMLLICVVAVRVCGAELAEYDLYFGTEPAPLGTTRVAITNLYNPELGYGFENVTSLGAGKNFDSSEAPFLFSVRVPEGNYQVTVGLGSDATDTITTIKAEARRLMVEQVKVPRTETVSRTFVVNVRRPEMSGGARVRLKSRELETEMVTWDDRLTLEFNGIRPAVRSLRIRPAHVPTVFLAGDSTVCDQPREPWNSWGQMLPRFLGAGVAVANYAESGESLKSSLGARRFDKIFSVISSNDWLLVQFGHNDMKERATNALAVYKTNLENIVARTRALGATPVLITSMERKKGIEHDTLGDYPQTVREVAREQGVALIDLHQVSKVFYRALGLKLDKAFQDGTHHNNYGSYELARCVVNGIRASIPSLAKLLAADAGAFDPTHPDDPDQFKLPASPTVDAAKPEGN